MSSSPPPYVQNDTHGTHAVDCQQTQLEVALGNIAESYPSIIVHPSLGCIGYPIILSILGQG